MAESFRILSPTGGAIVGRTVTLEAQATHIAGGTTDTHYVIHGMTVEFGASTPPVAATLTPPRTWTATGTLPAGSAGANQVEIRVTAEGLVTHPADVLAVVGPGPDTDPGPGPHPDPDPVTEDFVDFGSVIVVRSFPRVGFDPYAHEVTVTTLPYRLALTGTATDVADAVASVAVVVDRGTPIAARNVSGDWAHWAADLDLAGGQHTISVTATNRLGNVASLQDAITVKEPVEPGRLEQVFAITSYLEEVAGMAGRYIRLGGAAGGPSVASLGAMLHQPLDRLVERANFAAATADLAQARVAVDVLRGVMLHGAPAQLDQRFRAQAYDVLLRGLGTSSEELRLCRAADTGTRRALASRLGIELEGSRPDRLDAITIPADEISDGELEQFFGYRSTNPSDPLTTLEPAALSLWQQDALRALWSRTDAAERDGIEDPQPVIDPDLIVKSHLRSDDPGDLAHRLWSRRRAWIDERSAEIAPILDHVGTTADSFDEALAAAGLSINMAVLARQDDDGVDISGELAAVGLSLEAFRYLVRIRTLVEVSTVTASEWGDVASILVQTRKRNVFGAWRLEERQNGIVLQPAVFVADVDDDPVGFTGVLRWRAYWSALAQWRQTLAARQRQADTAEAAYRATVDAAERDVLPALRDELIAEIGRRHSPPQSALETSERLSRELSLDFRSAPGTRTTRAAQAVDSLQSLLVSLRSGRLSTVGTSAATVDDEANFDLEWAWLETYSRWRSAMEAFAYPESRLLPSLFMPEDLAPTEAYKTLMSGDDKRPGLIATPKLSPEQAITEAGRYLQLVIDEVHPAANDKVRNVKLTPTRSNAELDDYRDLCSTLTSGPPGHPFQEEHEIAQYLREIFWLVPVALARKLHDGGYYSAALDWYQTVFAYQFPGKRRFVYHGLDLEQHTRSDFGRTPQWLTFVSELNPHFTARHRNGAYTRFTVMSIVECFLGFADSEFARNAPDANARARALYQTASDLLVLPEVIPETGDDVPFPVNPVWQSLKARADIGLGKIHAGLNIAGQTDVTLLANDSVLPTVYRYGVVVERAKALVSIAQQVESAYLSALERADGANYDLLKASGDLRTAEGTVAAQRARVDAAQNGIEQADLQKARAQTQHDTYDQWIVGGQNKFENTALDDMKAAQQLQAGSAVFSGMKIVHESILAGVTGGFLGDPAGAISQALAATAGVFGTSAQIAETKAQFERRTQEWQLQRSMAFFDSSLADKQITGARTQHRIAELDRDVAVNQMDHARAVAEFLATKFTNAELYEWMSGQLARVYAFFLQQATAIARLAQAQLAFERQEPVDGYIAADYWQPTSDGDTAGAERSADRRGITGSTRLLQDVFRLDQQAFDTDRRKLHLSQTIAVSQIAAFELQQLRDVGVLTFATPEALFDRDFPGHYLRLIKRITVKMVLVAPTRGLRATLTASGVSRTVVPRNGFQTVTLRREPESISFTSPVSANGLFELEPEGAMLAPFEGMGVDTVWQLSLPKAANPIDYRTIADVLLTLEYTALDSPDHRQQVIRTLDSSFSGDRSFSLRNQFPDAWYDLNNPDTVDPANRMRAVLTMTRDDFPPHITDLTVAQLTLFVIRSDTFTDELNVLSLRHTIAEQTTEAGEVRTVGGIAGTRRPGAAPWQVFQDSEPDGTWELQFQDSATVRSAFTAEAVQDIVLVFTLAGTTPPWPS
jgi:hypothetical protein